MSQLSVTGNSSIELIKCHNFKNCHLKVWFLSVNKETEESPGTKAVMHGPWAVKTTVWSLNYMKLLSKLGLQSTLAPQIGMFNRYGGIAGLNVALNLYHYFI